MGAERNRSATAGLILATALISTPFLAIGVVGLVLMPVQLWLVAGLYAATVILAARPIRIHPDADLSPSDVAIVAGVVFLPPGAVAIVAAVARMTSDIIGRKRREQIIRNAAAIAISSGAASLIYAIVWRTLEPSMSVPASIPAAVVAVLALVAIDLGQLYLLLVALRGAVLEQGWRWFVRTGRAQLLWSLAAVITIEIILIEPWFLVPGIPLFYFGYLDIRARFVAERRARLLATLVEVGHAVGMSLDTTEVFRAVYAQVRTVLESDAFFVAIVDRARSVVSYRFLVDGDTELPGEDKPLAGTLAGLVVERDEPLLVRDTERDLPKLGLIRSAWGTLNERSLLVAPMRIQGIVVGAISVQSAKPNAYDEGDLELLLAIANEAALAIERADLYARASGLSKRLVELHRTGVQLNSQRRMEDVIQLFANAFVSSIGASAAAVYLDTGGESLEFAGNTTGRRPAEYLALPKSADNPVTATLASGRPIEITDADQVPEPMRSRMREWGHRALFVQPLGAASESVGALLVTWRDPHRFTDDERELIGVLAGMGATAIRSMRLYLKLDDAYLSTVSKLTAMIQARDGYHEDHQRRIAADAVAIGERLGLDDATLRDLRYASLFHSLGKIGVPATILAKSGPLTPEERRMVQEHPLLGARILESIEFLRSVVPIVRHANERWDGTGYPDGLKGEESPLAARILSVAMGYEAMLADRPYRHALLPDAAIAELRTLAGAWYDPRIVAEFITMIEARGAVAAAEVEVGASRELAILAEITPEFHTLLDMQQLLARILAILERHMPGSALTILLREETTGDLVLRSAAGVADLAGPARVEKGRGLSGWVVEHGEAQIVDDVRSDPRYIGAATVRSEMVVPLVSSGRAIGALAVSHPAVGVFGQRDLTLLQAVAAQIAAAIDVAELHERLKRAANTDALTGIHNYGYFYDRLEEEVARAERHGAPLAVAYFDIDGLKRVNDTYGHLAGDAVLRTLGGLIGRRVRTEDIPARYGGDEFAIVMPETPREEAERVVQRLMDELDSSDVELSDGRKIRMPARSWGIAAYPLDGKNAKALVENADTRVYARKRERTDKTS
jgi:diguanylate cyclase (GGDEF)-like protein